MNSLLAYFTDIDIFTYELTKVLINKGITDKPVAIIDRKPNLYTTTFPSEIVICRLYDGRELSLFCKYESDRNSNAFGHRNNIMYESSVYREILQPLKTSVPEFFGEINISFGSVVILEYIDNFLPINKVDKSDALIKTAEWIGLFHTACEKLVSQASLSFLNAYDAEYYVGWSRRTYDYIIKNHLDINYTWILPICKYFESLVEELLTAPMTIIHGEFYPDNILYQNGRICPVDWQTTAVGAGEIDLAALTDGWSEDVVKQCSNEYNRVRRHEDFKKKFNSARLYLQFRWLGFKPENVIKEKLCLERLYLIGKELGIV